MAWTAPRTWNVGELVTAAMLNTNVRDNMNAVLHPLAQDGTEIAVSNTTAATSLGSFTVPANTMGNNGVIDVMWGGDLLWNRSLSDYIGLTVQFGGVTILADTVGDFTSALFATYRPWSLHLSIINKGSTSNQFAQLAWEFAYNQSASPGIGTLRASLVG